MKLQNVIYILIGVVSIGLFAGPALGNYPNTTIPLGTTTTIMPDAPPPTNTDSFYVSTPWDSTVICKPMVRQA